MPTKSRNGATPAPLAAAGRTQVNAGDNILSAWGNQVFDQSVVCFDTAAQRDTQWPAPHPGSLCFTGDTNTVWVYKAGAWAILSGPSTPRGLVGSLVGPAALVSGVATPTTIMALTAAVIAGRRYALSLFACGVQQTSTASVYFDLASTANIDSSQARFTQNTSLAAAVYWAGSARFLYSPATSGNQTWTLRVSSNAGTFNVTANQCVMILEDIGGS